MTPLNAVRLFLSLLKRNWFWLKWPVAAGLLAFLFLRNRDQLGSLAEQRFNWFYCSVALLLCAGSVMLTFYRWYLLVWAQGFPFKLSDALRLGFIGYLMNYVSLGAAGGDLVKAVMIAGQQTSRRTIAAATVVLDRVLGLLALFMVGALASLFQPAALLQHDVVKGVLTGLWLGSAGGLIGMGIVLHPAVPRSRWLNRLVRLRFIGGLIGQLTNALLLYQQKRRYLVAAVAISIVGHFGMLSGFYFAALGVQSPAAVPGYWAHLLLIPLAELAGVLTPTPAGLGGLEWTVQYFYAVAHQALGHAANQQAAELAGMLTALGYRAITIIVAAVGAGYYLTARREITAALEETRDAEPA